MQSFHELMDNFHKTHPYDELPRVPINHKWSISYDPKHYYKPVAVYAFGKHFSPMPTAMLPRWVKALVDKLIIEHVGKA